FLEVARVHSVVVIELLVRRHIIVGVVQGPPQKVKLQLLNLWTAVELFRVKLSSICWWGRWGPRLGEFRRGFEAWASHWVILIARKCFDGGSEVLICVGLGWFERDREILRPGGRVRRR